MSAPWEGQLSPVSSRSHATSGWVDRIWKCTSGWLPGLIFPIHCACCQQPCRGSTERGLICRDCEGQLIPAGHTACSRCGRFVRIVSKQSLINRTTANCPACKHHRLWFDDTMALGPYQGQLRDVVLRSKRAHEEVLSLALGALLARQLQEQSNPTIFDYITCVPTPWKRRLQRGCATPELLLTGITSQLQIPAAPGMVRNVRTTQKQGTLNTSERHRNVSQAFRIKNPARVRGKHILVVDDVMTSGATLNEVARMLRRAGAQRISNVVVARGQCSH